MQFQTDSRVVIDFYIITPGVTLWIMSGHNTESKKRSFRLYKSNEQKQLLRRGMKNPRTLVAALLSVAAMTVLFVSTMTLLPASRAAQIASAARVCRQAVKGNGGGSSATWWSIKVTKDGCNRKIEARAGCDVPGGGVAWGSGNVIPGNKYAVGKVSTIHCSAVTGVNQSFTCEVGWRYEVGTHWYWKWKQGHC